MGGQVGEAMGNVQQSGSPQPTQQTPPGQLSLYHDYNDPTALGSQVGAVGPDYTGQGSQISTEQMPDDDDDWESSGVDWSEHKAREARLKELDPTGALVGVTSSHPYAQNWQANLEDPNKELESFDYERNKGVETSAATPGEMGAGWAVEEGFDNYEEPEEWENVTWNDSDLKSFVPAFMEVYSDLLKGLSPHEAGNLAASVFLKMTR